MYVVVTQRSLFADFCSFHKGESPCVNLFFPC